MAEVRGFQVLAGVGIESTAAYGTEVVATQRLRLLNETFKLQYTHIADEYVSGEAASAPPDQGVQQISGQVTVDWDYTEGHLLLRQFFGTFTTGATTATANAYTFDQTQDDIGLSLSFDKINDVFTYRGTKFHQLALTANAGEAVQMALDGFAVGEVINSTTNTTAALAALGAPPARILYHHCADNFRIGDHANTLTSDDGVQPSTFSLTINRQGTQFWTNTQAPEQSRENGFSSLDLSLTLPIYNSTQWTTWHQSHTALQCQIRFVNPAATDQVKTLQLNNLRVVDAPVPTGGPALIPQTVTLTGHHDLAGSNLSTEFGFTAPLRLQETI